MGNLDHCYAEENRQQAFVDHQSGTLVALAGPGTGKTYSFLLRIAELTENRHIDSASICYLTFIREIARAFKNDLYLKYPGQVTPQNITASTLHSFAFRLIRNRGHKVQLKGHLYPLNFCEEEDPIAEIAISDMKSALPTTSAIQTKTQLRQALKTVKTDWQNGKPVKNPVEQTYHEYSRAFKLLDWDEVIPLATSLYSDENDRPEWVKKYQHLLIDEYQDFNIAEQDFLGLISKSAASCVIVGDDDQSIYSSLRGASPNGIRELVQDPGVNRIGLVECRLRPPKQIVQCVNRFLSFMHTNPRLLEAVKPGGTVAVKSFKSAVAEIDCLVEHIKGLLGQINENTPPDDGVVCLFPTNKVLAQYRKEFENKGLKCKYRDSSKSLDDKLWVRILGTLAFQREQPFLERLVLRRFPDFKPNHQREVVAALLNGHTSVRSALSSIAGNPGWGTSALNAISTYDSYVESLTSGDATRVAACIDSLLPGETKCNPSHVENFLEADESILEDALDTLVAQIYRTGDEADNKANFEPAVELLTIHSSKGLTRRHVILPGLEHCWLPGNAAGDRLEECKRLFLVGITRATDSLLITYPRTRARGDSLNFTMSGRGKLSDFATKLGITVEMVM